MIKAVIFDMDGVLVDSQPLHFEADVRVLRRLGIEANLKTVEPYAGMSNADRWAKYKKDFDIALDTEKIIDIHKTIIGEMMSERKMDATPHVRELLEMIRGYGISTSVASSSSYAFVYLMLEKIGLRKMFDIVVSGEDMKNSKPAPDVFLAALEKHGCQKDECAIVEDSSNGVKAANAAGIFCIAYKNESSGKQNLAGAGLIVDDFKKLIENKEWLNV